MNSLNNSPGSRVLSGNLQRRPGSATGKLWWLALCALSGLAGAAQTQEDTTGLFSPPAIAYAEPAPLITNTDNREPQSLNGNWNVVIDKLGVGERGIFGDGYFLDRKPVSGMELIEYSFDERQQLAVPGDWNSQRERLFFYDGSIWYQRNLQVDLERGRRYFLHFGGANHTTTAYLNGEPLGQHRGGYTPFNFEVTAQLRDGENNLVVRVDNQLDETTVPTRHTDWWQYGGLTRDVSLLTLPRLFVRQFHLWLVDHRSGEIRGWAQLDGASGGEQVQLSIPELGAELSASADGDGLVQFRFEGRPQLWSPDNPKLYRVEVAAGEDRSVERIGFRTVSARGGRILLNGEPLFLRGISMHEESVLGDGVATSREDAAAQFALAKELGANFVRLAHYPHNEHTVRLADEMGLLLWSEVPVYWAIDWSNEDTIEVANDMLSAMVQRDLNRAAIIIWSLGNETPVSAARTAFMAGEAATVRRLDASGRLLAAALLGDPERELRAVAQEVLVALLSDPEVSLADKARIIAFIGREVVAGFMDKDDDRAGVAPGGDEPAEARVEDDQVIAIDLADPLGEIVDVVGYNEYFGWYYSAAFAANLPAAEADIRRVMLRDIMPRLRFGNVYGKPMVISEFGAGAKYGLRSPEALLWSEEYQAKVYRAQLAMLPKSPLVQGISPWVLKDFRAALRPLNGIQDFYNRKGLVDESGNRKLAFEVLAEFYRDLPRP